METLLIQGKQVSAYDNELMQALGASDRHLVSGQHTVWFGVKNEFGELYRTVGVADPLAAKQVLDRLRSQNWWVEVLEPERTDDLHFIVKKINEAADHVHD